MHCWNKVGYIYWEFDCIFFIPKSGRNIPIQTLIISPWIFFSAWGRLCEKCEYYLQMTVIAPLGRMCLHSIKEVLVLYICRGCKILEYTEIAQILSSADLFWEGSNLKKGSDVCVCRSVYGLFDTFRARIKTSRMSNAWQADGGYVDTQFYRHLTQLFGVLNMFKKTLKKNIFNAPCSRNLI